MDIILSNVQTQPLFEGRQKGLATVQGMIDLGCLEIEWTISPEGAGLPDGCVLSWEVLTKINTSVTGCFIIKDGYADKIQQYSNGRLYSLMPTQSAPTMLVSGVLMHRIKGTDPLKDTHEKIKTLGMIQGRVLDTATGLGYTAQAAANFATRVDTIEIEPAATAMAHLNPWSRSLFETPVIHRHIGDSFTLIKNFNSCLFNCIIHDPPVFSTAGHLYSSEFYRELLRVLQKNGRLFHYIGNPKSKSGARVTRGVIRRLQEAGFARVIKKERAFGVLAFN